MLSRKDNELERLRALLHKAQRTRVRVESAGRVWEIAEMTRRDRPAARLPKRKVDFEKVLLAAGNKHKERLRNAFGLWYHIVVEELEFLSAESGSVEQEEEESSSAAMDMEASMHRFTVSRLGPFYGDMRENSRALGDVDEIEEIEELGDTPIAEIKKVYVKEHAKLVNECARAHTQLMQTCSIRLLVSNLRQMSLRAQRESLDSLKVSMLQGIISGKQQAINTYEMEGDEVHTMADPANNLRVARGTLGPFRPTMGGRLSVTPLNSMLMERFYSKNGTNMANLVTSPQLVQSFLSYAKGLEGNVQRTKQWAARLLFRLTANVCKKSLITGLQSLEEVKAGPVLTIVRLEGIIVERSCKAEKMDAIIMGELSDVEDETDEGRPQAPGVVAYTALAGGLIKLGSEAKAPIPNAPLLTLNMQPTVGSVPQAPQLNLSGFSIPIAPKLVVPQAPVLSIPTAPQLSIPQAPSLMLPGGNSGGLLAVPLSTSLNVPKAPTLPSLQGSVASTPQAPVLSLPTASLSTAVPQAPTLSIPMPLGKAPPAPSLSPLLTASTIPQAPALGIPLAPSLGSIPAAPSLSIPAAPLLGKISTAGTIPQAPVLTTSLSPDITPLSLGVPQAPALAIPIAPSLGSLPTAPSLSIPVAPGLSIPQAPAIGIGIAPMSGTVPPAPSLSIPTAPLLSGLSSVPKPPALSVPQAPSLAVPLAPSLAVPLAPSLSIPQAPLLGNLQSLSIPSAPPLGGIPKAPAIPLAPSLNSVPVAPTLTLGKPGAPAAPSLVLGTPPAPSLSLSGNVPSAPSFASVAPLLAPVLSGVSQSIQHAPKPLPSIPSDLVTKKFHWEPLPKYKLAKTVWVQPSEDVDVDFPSLLSLFAEKAKVKEEAKAPAKAVVMILEQKKVNNVGILQSSES